MTTPRSQRESSCLAEGWSSRPRHAPCPEPVLDVGSRGTYGASPAGLHLRVLP